MSNETSLLCSKALALSGYVRISPSNPKAGDTVVISWNFNSSGNQVKAVKVSIKGSSFLLGGGGGYSNSSAPLEGSCTLYPPSSGVYICNFTGINHRPTDYTYRGYSENFSIQPCPVTRITTKANEYEVIIGYGKEWIDYKTYPEYAEDKRVRFTVEDINIAKASTLAYNGDIYVEGVSCGTTRLIISLIDDPSVKKIVTIRVKGAINDSGKIAKIPDKTYTGKAIKPALSVTYNGTKLKEGTDYKVTYKNNTKVGKATVTVTGIGDYIGTISKTFKIIPKSTTLSTLKPGSKQITATWKKQATQITGYQIQYSTSKAFKNAKLITLKSPSTVKYTLKKLTSNKLYYVRVRTYKTVGSVKYYSAWSKALNTRTKKVVNSQNTLHNGCGNGI